MLARNRKFADSPLEGRVVSELVSLSEFPSGGHPFSSGLKVFVADCERVYREWHERAKALDTSTEKFPDRLSQTRDTTKGSEELKFRIQMGWTPSATAKPTSDRIGRDSIIGQSP